MPCSMLKVWLSGAEYRKRRAEKEAKLERESGSFEKYLKTSNVTVDTSDRVSTNEKISLPSTSTCQDKYFESGLHDGSLDSDAALIVTKVEITEEEETVAILNLDLNSTSTEISRDPLKWPLEINDDIRLLLVKKGPIHIREKDNAEGKFPKDEFGRRFNESYYQRRMYNGEIILRSWLIYSKSADAVFCFCCKLFTTIQSALTSGDCNDWNHIGERLSSHEKSQAHLIAHKQWTELALRVRTNKTIDANHQRMLDDKARHWQNVFERLLAIIHFLAQQSLAYRGTSDKLYVHKHGNFFKLVKLISKFDTVISEHLLRIKDGRTQQHYHGKDIQN
ncbi:zinc finger MYM-type protein 5-like [Belonocnema kinseyi]|uniref:zinc finger MYM-type protein 5-like n=1 Tax=Belonocnema kinseyi TaxID=2817044 RepID=UPI00143CD3C1|nr:zinc finger MYM-type protein 5-like [Belonocnema kinseyi]